MKALSDPYQWVLRCDWAVLTESIGLMNCVDTYSHWERAIRRAR